MLDITKCETRILTRKLRTYLVCGALIFHFLDINPIRKYASMMREPTIPFIPNYIINETSSFIIDLASIWVMFIVADIMLKEKDLKMKEILSAKPIRKLDIFSGKFSACFLSISSMVGLIFVIAWIGEIYAGSQPHFNIYVGNYVLDAVPMMAFSISTVVMLSMIFRNTKITYIFYFLFRLLDAFFPHLPPRISVLFRTYYINSHYLSVSLGYHIFLKVELLLISIGFLAIAYILYSRHFLAEEGGFT
jgi:ABC-type transport system involved in multi-copper enzyme maturation permease subunit